MTATNPASVPPCIDGSQNHALVPDDGMILCVHCTYGYYEEPAESTPGAQVGDCVCGARPDEPCSSDCHDVWQAQSTPTEGAE